MESRRDRPQDDRVFRGSFGGAAADLISCFVVPANAGTHNPGRSLMRRAGATGLLTPPGTWTAQRMGPCFRRDDVGGEWRQFLIFRTPLDALVETAIFQPCPASQ